MFSMACLVWWSDLSAPEFRRRQHSGSYRFSDNSNWLNNLELSGKLWDRAEPVATEPFSKVVENGVMADVPAIARGGVALLLLSRAQVRSAIVDR